MNRISIIGRLTKDPETQTTQTGLAITRFSVAVNRRFKDTETGEYITDFFNVVAWRGLAENIYTYCKKGSKVFVSGELQNRTWDKPDGTKGYATEIIANECEFLDSKAEKEEKTETETKTVLEPVNDSDLPF